MVPKRIVVLGGSTVYGQGDPIGGGFVARLRGWHESNSPEVNRVFNLGVGGDTVALMLERAVPEVSHRRPDLLILYPGLNDTRRVAEPTAPPETDLELIRDQLLELTDRCVEICPVILMSATPPDERFTSPFRGRWFFQRSDAAVMAQLTKETAEEKQLPYFDLFERWAVREDGPALLADGLHCNAEGHQQLFEELREFLEKLFCRG